MGMPSSSLHLASASGGSIADTDVLANRVDQMRSSREFNFPCASPSRLAGFAEAFSSLGWAAIAALAPGRPIAAIVQARPECCSESGTHTGALLEGRGIG
jgi:hypothetical protein